MAITDLMQSGGLLGGTDTVNISGQHDLDGGRCRAGITNANGPASLSGGGLQRVFSNRRLNTNAATSWSATNEFRVDNGGQIVNAGTWSVTNNQGINNVFGGAASFTNTATGIFRKTAGTGTSSISISLTNDGLVDSLSGTVAIAGGGAGTGDFTVTAPGTLSVNSTYAMNTGASVAGTGVVQVPGTYNFNAGSSWALTGNTNVSGTLSFATAPPSR